MKRINIIFNGIGNVLGIIFDYIKLNIFAFITVVVFLCILSFVIHNKREQNPKMVYSNINLKIVCINSDCSLTDDKFHKPQLCNTVLFETITSPHLYCEINTCELKYTDIHITTEWLYNHQKGDTINFDYLLKSRFFKIKNR